MALETITREEFDRRLEAANESLRREAETLTAQNEALAQLTARYQSALRELETQAKPSNESSLRLRATLLQLAEQSVSLAASL